MPFNEVYQYLTRWPFQEIKGIRLAFMVRFRHIVGVTLVEKRDVHHNGGFIVHDAAHEARAYRYFGTRAQKKSFLAYRGTLIGAKFVATTDAFYNFQQPTSMQNIFVHEDDNNGTRCNEDRNGEQWGSPRC